MAQHEMTPEDYQNYRSLKDTVLRLKGERSDMFDVMRELELRFNDAKKRFEQIQTDIDSHSAEFQNFVNALFSKYELKNISFFVQDSDPPMIVTQDSL